MSYKSEYAYEYKHIMKFNPKKKEDAYKFCEGYKSFLDSSKTERDCTATIIRLAKENGYKEFDKNGKLNAGDKYYFNNRNKSVILMTIGKTPLEKGINFLISHIDSPRIDLKSNPIYESDDIAYFKTHYYGGIKKYQWTTIPLAMHGRMFKSDNEYVDFSYGEKDDEPKFMISDLLPHLAIDQSKRTLAEGINAEELNIIIGSLPIEDPNDEIKNAVKEFTLKVLYEKFGVKERDFARAEIEFVPAYKACDIGFDRSMIASYGHDDKVCAYPSLMAEFFNKGLGLTSVAVFTDKEEIGSEGNTGMVSDYLFHIVEDLADMEGVKARDIYRNSLCISSDVDAAFDPTFADVFEKANASHLNCGVIVTKFTGHRGKSDANDASAETVAEVIRRFDKDNVVWQTAEFGKVDIGGGGTIAKYVSARNIDTIDIGVPVLSMHAPYEIVSKLDVYETYLAYKAFLSN